MIWLLCATSWAAKWERKPYVQAVGQDEVTLMWMSDEPVDAAVRWGRGILSSSQSVSPSTQIAEQRITGLLPDTRYEYEVTIAGEPAFTSYFHTAPAPGGTAPVRVWVLGDSGSGRSGQLDVRDAMLDFVASRPPDLLLHVGDMAYGSGTEQEFSDNYFSPYAEILAHTPMYGAIGNHEYGNSISSSQTGPYFEAYAFPTDGRLGGVSSGTEAYYSADYGDLHIVVLDSNTRDLGPDSAMLAWLDQDLAATSAEWIIALWHHPPYSKGSHDSDREGVLIELREYLMPRLDSAGVDLVLVGHSHIYERSFLLDGAYDSPSTTNGILDGGSGSPAVDGAYAKPLGINANQGTVHIVAGHGGKGAGGAGGHPLMAFDETELGSVILDFYDNVLTLRNVRYDGVISDSATLVKGDALVLATPDFGALAPGGLQRVAWESVGSGVSGPVELAWSCDGGDSWRPVASGLPATGEVSWTIPAEHTSAGVFQVRAASGHSDTSDAPLQVVSGSSVEVLPLGSTWAYLDSGAASTGWQVDPYSTWPMGPGPLGYGAASVDTEIDDFVQPSVYFRTRVDTVDLDAFALRAEYNDGIVVWLDGVEVLRANVDDDLHQSYASATVGLPMLSTYAGGPLSAGPHELAVMVKQDRSDGEDLYFDLSITGTLPELPPCNDPGPIDTASHTGVDSDRIPGDTEQLDDSDTEAEAPQDSEALPTDSGEPVADGCGCGSAGGLGLAWLLGFGVLVLRRRSDRLA